MCETAHVGFRRVEVAGGALLVNGAPVVINGVDRHENHPDTGRATAEDTRRDLELMKPHHINAVRTWNYPMASRVLRPVRRARAVRDRRGRRRVPRQVAVARRRPGVRRRLVEPGLRMVLRDRSHPASSRGRSATSRATGRPTTRWQPGSGTSTIRGRCTTRAASAAISTPTTRCRTSSARCTPRWSGSSSGSARDGIGRPLVLCEYSHTMGQAGGLADYWAVFGVEQGCRVASCGSGPTTGSVAREADGTTWSPTAASSANTLHDGRFVCDGLVSPDREPHPLLLELAALTQPVGGRPPGPAAACGWRTAAGSPTSAISTLAGRRPRRRRRHPAAWRCRSGPAAARGRTRRPTAPAPAAHLTVAVPTPPAGAGWAPAGRRGVTLDRGRTPDPGRPARRRLGPVAAVVGDDGVVAGRSGRRLAQSCRCGGRPPTTTIRPARGGRRPGARLAPADGLDRLTIADGDVRRRDRATARIAATPRGRTAGRAPPATGVGPWTGALEASASVVDRAIRDLPRVGVRVRAPSELRPGSLARARSGRQLSRPPSGGPARAVGLRRRRTGAPVHRTPGARAAPRHRVVRAVGRCGHVAGDRPLAFSALRHSAGELEVGPHAHEAPARTPLSSTSTSPIAAWAHPRAVPTPTPAKAARRPPPLQVDPHLTPIRF